MTNSKRLKANRSNANKSTGPKTKSGKIAVAKNAIVHGVLSNIAVVPGLEQAEEWEKHLAEFLMQSQKS